ncbi:MAG TPA: methionine gamma-lyase [Candidatus Limnocylindrales bacterium]|jgi:methionine gamma-lyase|nr:methionine gamma-lyase [Candidatus Limnocylindrales bacterium]
MNSKKPLGMATRAIHSGYDPLRYEGALNPPVFMTSTYAFPDAETGSSRFAGRENGYIYSRMGNPTVAVLERRIADLEGAEGAVGTASGMGAITAAIWSLVQSGDEIVSDMTLYGCTYSYFVHGLARFGVSTNFVDLTQPEQLERAITPRTRLVFFETPCNPNLRVIDIARVTEIAHSFGVPVIVDNTCCTPMLQRPLELGADIVVHSATKYLGGHGDLLAGLVCGRSEAIERVRMQGVKDLTGAVMSPMDAFLILRGLKTLELRMERHCASALELAQRLQNHPAVTQVLYPGLSSFPQHEVARRQMSGFGGMIAFEIKGGLPATYRFMDSLELVTRAVSLGDADSFIQHPASMTHSAYTPQERAHHGITDGMLRLSVGLENVEDILNDLVQALSASQHERSEVQELSDVVSLIE